MKLQDVKINMQVEWSCNYGSVIRGKVVTISDPLVCVETTKGRRWINYKNLNLSKAKS